MMRKRTCIGWTWSLIVSVSVGSALTVEATAEPVDASDINVDEIAEQMDLADLSAQALTAPADRPEQWSIDVTVNGQPLTLDLTKRSVRSENFRVRVDDGKGALREVPAPPVSTYVGEVQGQPNSVAAATIMNGAVRATIQFDDGSMWHVQPIVKDNDRQGGQPVMHAVYNHDDIKPGNWSCGVEIEQGAQPNGQAGAGASNAGGDLPELAEIAFDADVEFFQWNGSSVDNTVEDIESILNDMSAIYEQDVQIIYELTEIIVRTSEPDPYTTSFPPSLLNQFAQEWNFNQSSIQRDLAHLMTGKNLTGGTIGIASLGVVCVAPNSSYGLSQSNFSFNFAARVALTTHEVGHNWNATHCDGAPDCSIMCSGLGGCSGVITSFGSDAINQITAWRDFTNCTPPASLPPENNVCDEPELAVFGTQEYSTENAETTGPAHPGSDCLVEGGNQVFQDVWYAFPFGCEGEVTFSLCSNTNFDSRIAVYDMQCPTENDVPIACNDNACGVRSSVTVQSDGSQTFFIRIGGAEGATGSGILEITCEETPCPADIAGDDGVVNVSDLLSLLGAWGPCGSGSCEQDLDDSGTVDVSDLLELLGEWGPCS